MNAKFHTINLGRANPTHEKAALFSGAGFSYAERETPKERFEKGKCYEIHANAATYQIRFIEFLDGLLRAEFWYDGSYGGVGAFYEAELVREIPQIPIQMVRGERYVAKLKGLYAGQTWLFDFNEYNGYIYYLTFCDNLSGYSQKGRGCLVHENSIDFIVPERVWSKNYAKPAA